MTNQLSENPSKLFEDVCKLINSSKSRVASTANIEMTLLYWKIGQLINNELLDGQRADYGKQIVSQAATQLSWSHFYRITIAN